MAELEALLQQEIPNGRKALLDGKVNLENVANYCQQLYVDSENKKAALDETKNYTTQSLASVAYQINTLANNMLHMLDIQATELANMESSINHISMTVDVHKEKVARREIGLLTTNKTVTRHHQIVAPAVPDRAVKYVRKPIDYTELDDIGHGVKIANQQSGQGNLAVRRPSKTPSPSVDGRKRDSLKSATGSISYGTIRAVRTPTVPTEYNSTKRLPSMYSSRARTNSNSSSGSGSISSSSGYYPGPGMPPASLPPPPVQGPPPPPSVPSAMPPPPVDGHHSMPPPPPMNEPPPPIPPMAPPAPVAPLAPMPPQSSMPPPPSMPPLQAYDPLPPPPSMDYGTAEMPPPPMMDDDMPPPPDSGGMMPPPPDDFPSPYNNHDDSSSTAGSNYGSSDPAWAPKEYIQKVIAIYDYSAENADELTLHEDEIVYVVKKNDDGWFEGVSHGVTGLFPGNYVETISV